VAAVAPRPVNVLMSASTGLRLSDLAEIGVRRVSVGGALARAAWTGFLAAAIPMAREGSFAGLDGTTPFDEINGFFRDESARR
jgi:2-methylisocitrate lyase-like PEP mutase family enzyme